MTFESTGGRPATPEESAELRLIPELRRNQLPSVRAAAEKWRNGIGLSAGIGTAVSSLAAPDVLKGAPASIVVNGAWLLGITLLVAGAALGMAMRASWGWPRDILLTDPLAYTKWQNKELARTLGYLRWSMIGVLIAVLLMGCSAAVLLFHVPWFWHFPGWVGAGS